MEPALKNTGRSKEGAILEATFECIYEKGIAAVSMRSIAAKIGSNQSLIHYYFRNKENLIVELMRSLFDTMLTEIKKFLKNPVPPEERLDMIAESGKSFFKTSRKTFVVFIDCWSLAARNQSMRKILSKLYADNRKVFEEALENEKKQGAIKTFDTEFVALSIISYISGLALHKYMTNQPLDIDAHLDMWAESLKQIVLKKKSLKA